MGSNNEEMFKTTLMGGYDKDDVVENVTRMKDQAYAEKTKLLNSIKEKDKKIAELTGRLEQKDLQVEALEKDIHEKYQKYIDNYDSIGRLVFEAQMKADTIVKDAEAKRDIMMEQAQEASTKCLESVQKEVDDKLAEGKKKYIAMQEELNEIVDVMNQVQRRFMESCKSVYNIISTMPESLQDLEDDIDEDVYADQPEEEPVLEPEVAVQQQAAPQQAVQQQAPQQAVQQQAPQESKPVQPVDASSLGHTSENLDARAAVRAKARAASADGWNDYHGEYKTAFATSPDMNATFQAIDAAMQAQKTEDLTSAEPLVIPDLPKN